MEISDKNFQIRTCVVTKTKHHKKKLIRIRKYKGIIEIDITGKKEGRGCYILPNNHVYQELLKKNFIQISKALKTNLKASDIEYLKNQLPIIIKNKSSIENKN